MNARLPWLCLLVALALAALAGPPPGPWFTRAARPSPTLRVAFDEIVTNRPALRVVWLEQSEDLHTWAVVPGSRRTNGWAFVTNNFGFRRTHTWEVTNGRPHCFWRGAGVGW